MEPPQRVQIDLSFRFILKVFAALCFGFCLIQLASLLVLTVFSILIAVTLQPLRSWLARRIPLWMATTLVSLGLIGAVALVFGFLVPAVIAQVAVVTQDWPRIQGDILRSVPEHSTIRP
ncbi:MAG: AI-2E family transporter, partial [Bdellovibrionia bacterium]